MHRRTDCQRRQNYVQITLKGELRLSLLYSLDKTYTFVYNEGGNIVTKKEYTYTEGELGTPIKTYSYTYGNTWKDQLTSFDGQSITYDASGNPTSYLGNTLTWSRGRLLTSFVNGTKTVTMQYDANGIRKSKTAPAGLGVTKNVNYIYDSEGRLRTETVGTSARQYLYSSDGIMGYEENGERFLYRNNLFGDITAIYKGATKVAEYVYDAWGNCTITYDPDGIGARNPFRYRGYYWDNDIQMYYLMTRYYDPKTGRFINADSIEYLEPKEINGLNLYAYCGNNPVMNIDPIGTLDYTAWYGEDGYNPGSDDWFYQNAYGGGYESGYYGSGSAYYNYYVSSNTAAYDAYGGGYYYPGVSSGVANPGYYIVPSATVVTDGMGNNDFYMYNVHSLPNSAPSYSTGYLYRNGAIKQIREYDGYGKPRYDIDYDHPQKEHTFPHIHYWDWSQVNPRGKAEDYIN